MKNFEVKDNLAKLLATENLIVEHRQVSTAFFNVETRVLCLPMWDASDNVYDMLVGHEVGHALYTPVEPWKKGRYEDVPPSFVNVIEDARIEKLMKRRYGGLSKSFYKGYKELHVKDFFEIDGKDFTEFAFIDRINLYFKLGSFEVIPFKEDELPIVETCKGLETFEEVLELCLLIYNNLKDAEEEIAMQLPELDAHPEKEDKDDNKTQDPVYVENDKNGTDDSNPLEDLSTGKGEKEEKRFEEDQTPDQEIINPEQPWDTMSNEGGIESNLKPDEFTAETQEAFNSNQRQLVDEGAKETVYLDFPKLKMDKIVVDHQRVSTYLKKWWKETANEEFRYHYSTIGTDDKLTYSSFGRQLQEKYLKYKKESSKGVNYLVKEFECRKSADAYSRAATSRTGVLDTKKLHTYKFNEDLFKKITVLPEGKNHGLIFILDWSGSMHFVINDTVKQLLNLLWFCKKVNIPFEVYGFTNDSPAEWRYPSREGRGGMEEIQIMKENEIYCHPTFRLLNFVSSDSGKDFEEQCLHLFNLSYSLQCGYSDYVPYGFNLSGTPLNETIIALRELIPDFFRKHQVSKLNTVLLTDGESQSISRVNKVQSYYNPDEMEFGRISLHSRCQLRDRKIGRVYHACNEWNWRNSITQTLLQNLEDNFPNCNIIGIRLLQSGEVSRFHYQYKEDENYTDQDKKSWSKTRSAILKPTGYSVLYGIASSSMNSSEEFEVKENATKAQIRSAFKKNLKNKSANKKVLSSFIDMVA